MDQAQHIKRMMLPALGVSCDVTAIDGVFISHFHTMTALPFLTEVGCSGSAPFPLRPFSARLEPLFLHCQLALILNTAHASPQRLGYEGPIYATEPTKQFGGMLLKQLAEAQLQPACETYVVSTPLAWKAFRV
jgi:Cft2 family RNA processing exonuclease